MPHVRTIVLTVRPCCNGTAVSAKQAAACPSRHGHVCVTRLPCAATHAPWASHRRSILPRRHPHLPPSPSIPHPTLWERYGVGGGGDGSPSPVLYFLVTTKLEPKKTHAISTAMRPIASADAAIVTQRAFTTDTACYVQRPARSPPTVVDAPAVLTDGFCERCP